MIQEAIRKLREQQSKVREGSPQWMVAQQLVDLCRAGSYVTICSRAHLRRLVREGQGEDNPVYAFRIQGWDKLMDIELVSHRDSRPLNYLESFREMMCQVVRAEDEAIQAWLPTQRC